MGAAPPPTILFMGRIFDVPWGGVREVADALLGAAAKLCAAQGRRIEVLVPRAGICPVRTAQVREVVLPRFGSNRFLWDHWTVSNHANRQRNAVLYNVKLVLPERLRIPGFTTFHDLMYFPQPDKYDWREYLLADSLYMRFFIPRTVRRASSIHTVSEYTARDARELFPDAPADRFRPIHHGVEEERWNPRSWSNEDRAEWRVLEAAGLREPYVFHSGGLSRRKNVRVLAAAFGQYLKRHPEYQLVLTGGAKPTTRDGGLRRALNRIPPGKVIRLGTVSSRALALLYQRAASFVFPSLYEGFGLPVLEAQAARCPVICSNATCLPEVVGDSALLFDPRSPRALLERMELLEDEGMRRQIVAAGERNITRFRWEETARRWLELADEVYRRGCA